MTRTVGIGHQNFETLITNNNFYIDKTMFIKEWWENDDAVTLITRPRRFGKTLNMRWWNNFFPRNMQKKAAYLKDCPSGKKKSSESSRENSL